MKKFIIIMMSLVLLSNHIQAISNFYDTYKKTQAKMQEYPKSSLFLMNTALLSPLSSKYIINNVTYYSLKSGVFVALGLSFFATAKYSVLRAEKLNTTLDNRLTSCGIWIGTSLASAAHLKTIRQKPLISKSTWIQAGRNGLGLTLAYNALQWCFKERP